MYAYCLNNPVIGYDPTGHSPKTWIKGFVGNFLDPLVQEVKEIWAQIIPGTVAVGKSVSAAAGPYVGVSEGFALDETGGFCEFYTFTGGAGTPSAGGSIFASVTNATNVDYLREWSEQVGGSCPLGGYEKVFMINDNSPDGFYHGSTISFGPDSGVVPAELHATQSYTVITRKSNIFLSYDLFSLMIKNW